MIFSHWTPTYPILLCFLRCLLNPLVSFPVRFCSFCFITDSSSNHCFHHRGRDPRLPRRSSPGSSMAVLSVVYIIVVFMSMSSSLRSIIFPPIVAWKVYATFVSFNFSRSNLSLGWFGFLSVFRWTWKVIITRSRSLPISAPGKLLLVGNASSLRYSQSDCGASCLSCATFIVWMVVRAEGVCQYKVVKDGKL